MASKMSERLNFKSVEELLGVVNEEAAMDIEIYKISGFKGHPFKVIDDEKMQELVESIKVNGVLSPVLIRPTGHSCFPGWLWLPVLTRFRCSWNMPGIRSMHRRL